MIATPDIEYCFKHNIDVDFISRPWLCKATSNINTDDTIKVKWYKKDGHKWSPAINQKIDTIFFSTIIYSGFQLENEEIPCIVLERINSSSKLFQEQYEKARKSSFPRHEDKTDEECEDEVEF